MSAEERRAWIMLVVSPIAYILYVILVLGSAEGEPLTRSEYVSPLLFTVVGAIVVSILLNIVGSIIWSRGANLKDLRDRQISRIGDHIGQSFVIAGALAAMLMAFARLDYFWIANTLYLAFFLSAILGSVVKVIGFRRGLPEW